MEILRYGSNVRVIEPKGLVKMIAEELRKGGQQVMRINSCSSLSRFSDRDAHEKKK